MPGSYRCPETGPHAAAGRVITKSASLVSILPPLTAPQRRMRAPSGGEEGSAQRLPTCSRTDAGGFCPNTARPGTKPIRTGSALISTGVNAWCTGTNAVIRGANSFRRGQMHSDEESCHGSAGTTGTSRGKTEWDRADIIDPFMLFEWGHVETASCCASILLTNR